MYTKLLTEVTSGRGVGEYVCISVHVCVAGDLRVNEPETNRFCSA